MVFNIEGKVAIITGGASGIGLSYAKELLRNGAKGVTLADVNAGLGEKAVQEIENEFGPNKAIFVPADVTIVEQLESAFQKTIEAFTNIDILINNAGIADDSIWEREIAINLNGTIHGMILGVDKYLPKHKQGEEAVIVNISSNAGTQGYGHVPIYTATKHAVLGLTKSWGIPEFYEQTKVRVIAICPGVTMTTLMIESSGRNLGGRYQKLLEDKYSNWQAQEPEFVAKEAIKVIKYAPNGTSWLIEDGEPAYEYVLPHRNTMKANVIC